MYEPRESLAERLARKEFLIGTFIQDIRSPFVIQLAAGAGLDFVILDGEHGAWSEESLANMIKMARALHVLPLVRVLAPEYIHICPRLDAGAQGLVIPRIRQADEVRQAVSLARYPPEGVRGAVSLKGQSDYTPIDLADFTRHHNRTPIIIPQIENREAVEDLDHILGVEGVAAVFIGPSDLSVSYGLPGKRYDPNIVKVMDAVLEKTKERDVPCAILAPNIQDAAAWRHKGMRILCVGADATFLNDAFTTIVNALR